MNTSKFYPVTARPLAVVTAGQRLPYGIPWVGYALLRSYEDRHGMTRHGQSVEMTLRLSGPGLLHLQNRPPSADSRACPLLPISLHSTPFQLQMVRNFFMNRGVSKRHRNSAKGTDNLCAFGIFCRAMAKTGLKIFSLAVALRVRVAQTPLI
jgi:hypothetical protein